ncbi:MAG: protecting protein DprA protein [Candidatus Woesebacteria bacterium GW2011_GWA1_37_7]|uniref:Protecting protein DprA protein n=1 Tax=Candidatus Woesebacteria bacterium GW2011_GWA1_37_7 TaxID=1618545 RepID=A0A0G0H0I1_9BACT|nr:MAG: protecting protein DprA protein [Candidatus Woesebacteria bacterium GW2011_GWA1_37_7]
MYDANIKYLTALAAFPDFGPKRTELLIKYFGSPKKAWEADPEELLKIGLKNDMVLKFGRFRKNFAIVDYFGRLDKLGIRVLAKDDKEYPLNLTELDDAPLVLYIRGKLKVSDVNAIAIVGARKMTSYGREVAYKFASDLAGLGITIVSGLALGIDAVAHKGALEAGGRCIAVIASALDNITPSSNYHLAVEIVKRGGAVISEAPLGTEVFRSSFPIRNRIVSGLSKAVIVVEGARKSGTLLTASHAADQGRSVFAIPGQITSPMSEAPLYLIQNGAKMAISVNDILEELNLQLKVDRAEVERLMPKTQEEAKLLEIISNEPMHLDNIGRITGLNVSDISARLTVMELKGLVKNIGGGVYKKT